MGQLRSSEFQKPITRPGTVSLATVLDPLSMVELIKTPRCWDQARVQMEGCSLSEKEEGAAKGIVSLWFYWDLKIAPSPLL